MPGNQQKYCTRSDEPIVSKIFLDTQNHFFWRNRFPESLKEDAFRIFWEHPNNIQNVLKYSREDGKVNKKKAFRLVMNSLIFKRGGYTTNRKNVKSRLSIIPTWLMIRQQYKHTIRWRLQKYGNFSNWH